MRDVNTEIIEIYNEVMYIFRKVLLPLAVLLVFLMSASSFAYGLRIGALAKLNSDTDEYASFYRTWNAGNLPAEHGKDDRFVFFDSTMSMLMALGNGDVDEIDLPGIVGAYVMNMRPDFEIKHVVKTKPEYLAFGFLRNKGEDLCAKINGALKEIKSDGTLADMYKRYLKVDGTVESVEFTKFSDADTIRVAVTGDLPPIDFVGPDGRAAGFNTALIAEIGRRLKINIRLVYVNSGARSAALVSGRADTVFWYQLTENGDKRFDVPNDVIVSEPYFDWDSFVHIGMKYRYNDD